jgi:hypothetical protein
METIRPLVNLCKDSPGAEGIVYYAKLLLDIEPRTLSIAVDRFLSDSEDCWFPSPGKLRKLCSEIQLGAIPGWETAWATIMESVAMWSQFDRQKADAARAYAGSLMSFVTMLGGFYTLANSSASELRVSESNFRSAWSNQKQDLETQRKLPASAQSCLPPAIRKNLESFGKLSH